MTENGAKFRSNSIRPAGLPKLIVHAKEGYYAAKN